MRRQIIETCTSRPLQTPEAAVIDLPDDEEQLAPFRCDVFHADDRAIVSVRGEVDLATAPTLQREVIAALALPIWSLRVDLRHVTFLDSSGVSVLVVISEMADELGIAFTLASVPGSVRRVLDVTGLSGKFGLTVASDEPDLPFAE